MNSDLSRFFYKLLFHISYFIYSSDDDANILGGRVGETTTQNEPQQNSKNANTSKN